MKNRNPRDWLNRTPLHFAAINGHMSVCRLILSNVENKNPGDDDGVTPLDFANENGHLEEYQAIMNLPECKKKNLSSNYLTPSQLASKNYYDNYPTVVVKVASNQ